MASQYSPAHRTPDDATPIARQTRPGLAHVLACLPWVALLAWLAHVAWFLCDDAFISFRYVRNLVEGQGLVFNPGEFVEGYTNFLWVLELAAMWAGLGIRPEQASLVLSVAYTLGTVLLVAWWAWRSCTHSDRALVAWIALGLVCSNSSFAVWTSSGLETRQFTFFIVLAVVCLALRTSHRAWLGTTSVSLAAAAYTRPEGLMLAAICFSYYVCHELYSHSRVQRRELITLVGPFAVLIAAHFAFRYGYYGDWLPNTYYAKHVRPWYESGFRYLVAAVLETGLWILLPLTAVTARLALRRHTNAIPLLVLACVLAHMAYLLRIGGDHFEFRPLDFYWPLLAVPAAQALAHLGHEISLALVRTPGLRRLGGARTCAVILFVPVLVYAGALQGTLLVMAGNMQGRVQTSRLHIELDASNARPLLMVPGMPMIVAISNDLRRQCIAQLVGARFAEHREFAKVQRTLFKRYERARRGVIPGDARMALATVGVLPFYVPDLQFIDIFGLVDATIARHHISTPNAARMMAHDRRPPLNYLQQRGVNFVVHGSAASRANALARANYALEVGPNIWMPFDVGDHQWANERFADQPLQAMHRFSPTLPGENLLRVAGRTLRGEQFLGVFEHGLDGWTMVEGDAVSNHRDHTIYAGQVPVFGHVGPGFLTTYHPSKGDAATGSIRSPEFVAKPGQSLAFLLGGGASPGLVLRLRADDLEIATWRGTNAEVLALTVYDLRAVAGQRLRLELSDRESGNWGHLILDQVMLVGATD